IDLRNEKIGFKIREHTLQHVPYMIIVGKKELENKQVAVRKRDGADLGAMPLTALIATLQQEVAQRTRPVASN
ncbi:MAG TPA: His/Gly/Thr/Pro-type tRNA ligase C-terminal domain-containing protein, partial [Gammaproteobacteria bacterium]|nr:His/Gly/Thr/Pro-type tRNA ligase C-terminal domain-containing protein [Gammaproteobacteria bacterium]